MRAITEQDVLKAFYRFDCKKLPVMDINGSFTTSMDVAMRKRLCAEWMDAFAGLEADIFAKAADIALTNCKKYPTLDEMFEFIALADGECTRAEQPVPEAQFLLRQYWHRLLNRRKSALPLCWRRLKLATIKKRLNVLPELEMIKNFMILQGSCFRMLLLNGLVITVLNWTGL